MVYPITPGLFSHSPGLGRLRGLDAKNQGYYQPIEMKLFMSQYSHESMPDANLSLVAFLVLEI